MFCARCYEPVQAIIIILHFKEYKYIFSGRSIIPKKKMEKKKEENSFILRLVSGVVVILVNVLFIYSPSFIFTDIFAFALGLLMAFEWGEIIRTSNKKRCMAILGVIYIIATLVPFLIIKNFLYQGSHLLMWLFLLVWSVDTFAYLVGAKFKLGKHKITKISPNKSYEGFLGGTLAAVIFCHVFASHYLMEFKNTLLFFTPILCILEQTSDITESFLKRKFNVKDSGNFIPGHGGFLDRYDGFLFTSLAFLLLLIL
ncbi:MAG: phosphatidate cytidylyltransferase [Rickettsiales bacterium]|jgi:phosphatidate cytidylyltransferase|nr:phosphatidate cytidylyltransferase [Rickettsiales bacterium]